MDKLELPDCWFLLQRRLWHRSKTSVKPSFDVSYLAKHTFRDEFLQWDAQVSTCGLCCYSGCCVIGECEAPQFDFVGERVKSNVILIRVAHVVTVNVRLLGSAKGLLSLVNCITWTGR